MTLTKLGNPDAEPGEELEVFPGTKGTKVTLKCTEFTCRCPVTNQPDWSTIVVHYVARWKIVESKSVKLFLETYRDKGVFHEHLVWELLDVFVEALDPLSCTVSVKFNSRGGIAITAQASYKRPKEEAFLSVGRLRLGPDLVEHCCPMSDAVTGGSDV